HVERGLGTEEPWELFRIDRQTAYRRRPTHREGELKRLGQLASIHRLEAVGHGHLVRVSRLERRRWYEPPCYRIPPLEFAFNFRLGLKNRSSIHRAIQRSGNGTIEGHSDLRRWRRIPHRRIAQHLEARRWSNSHRGENHHGQKAG